jgi:lipopolysaccharide/colanic/teichoic acid biosynthesis glycosyltransferase
MYTDLLSSSAHPKTECMNRYAAAPDEIKTYLNSTVSELNARDFCWVNSGSSDEVHHFCRNSEGIVNLFRMNDIRYLNPFLERVNRKIPDGAYFIACLETKDQRKQRIYSKFPRGINAIYYTVDFILKRVMPKLKVTRQIYFRITNGRNRVITRTEALGRLVCCGFSIIGTHEIGYRTFIITRKTGNPALDRRPTYGTLCKLQRIGKDGNMFTVYKLRTMHPYSEYLQEFMVKNNSLKKGGKINNDFRITSWGRLLRKFWIDELPMLWNWLRREMKLVGVRPLSPQYYSLYPEEVRSLRNKVRPGLIPPFYADLPETLEEIAESERKYIESYLLNPVRTDIQYFCRAVYNIVIKKARSQ